MDKKTPLYETHVRQGAKMVEFGGWLMPVQYSGILAEHRAVREQAGLFDVSHMGEVMITGPEATAYLQRLVTNDVTRIADNQAQYTAMCYPDGGTVDDLLIYRYGPEEYLLVINAANIDKDYAWMQEHTAGFAVQTENISAETAEIALQGPLARTILEPLASVSLAELGYYRFLPEVSVAGKPVMLSRTGYTGEDGFEIYCRPEDAADIWESLMTAGQPYGLLAAGLGCRDTLRLEACLPLYGHELSETISPLEGGIGKFVSFDKGDFIGRAALLAQKEQGLKRKVAGIVLTERGIARAGYPVLSEDRNIGTVTSGSFAPTLEQNVGLALLEAGFAAVGQKLAVEIRGKQVAAEVVTRPFHKRTGSR